MSEVGASPEEFTSAPDQPQSGFREALKKVTGFFRGTKPDANMTAENITNGEPDNESRSVPPDSGYAELIKRLSSSDNIEMNTGVVNELITLYPEFINLLEGSEVTHVNEVKAQIKDALQSGNKDIIAALAQRFIQIKLKRDTVTQSDRNSSREDNRKAVLADQLAKHMDRLVFQQESRHIDLKHVIFNNNWEALLPKPQQASHTTSEINGVPIAVREGLLDVPFSPDGSPK